MKNAQATYSWYSILSTCRQLYCEAIPHCYSQKLFTLATPAIFREFAEITYLVHNEAFVRSIRINIHFWAEDNAVLWRELLEARQLQWYFPRLEKLVIDFALRNGWNEFKFWGYDGVFVGIGVIMGRLMRGRWRGMNFRCSI